MDIGLLLIAFVVIIVLIIRHRNESRRSALEIQDRLSELQKNLNELHKQIKLGQPPVSPSASPAPTPKPVSIPVPITAPTPTYNTNTNIPDAPVGNLTPPEILPNAVFTPPSEPETSWLDRWLQRNPDLEKFVGENLINKIGIAVLVFGIAFFVKYAIDKDWINETGRVVIGLLTGSGLVVLAHRLSKDYRSFSSVLAAGGIATFYFTITLAFQQYHLFSQTVAFLVMVVITGFAVWLSILYDRLELAVIATVGGFLTPFFVSNGNHNYVALFVYMTILNSGLLALAYFRKWTSVRVIAFLFTLVIFGSWMIFDNPHLPASASQVALVFATIFYFQFVGMHIIYNLKNNQRFGVIEFFSLLITNLAYFGASMILLGKIGAEQWKGLFTAMIASFNLVPAFIFYRQERVDHRFVLLLLGIAMSFITLAAPIQLNGHYITMFWAAESVLLIWFFFKTQLKLVQVGSLLVSIFCLISLVQDWGYVYDGVGVIPVIINQACIGTIVVVTAMAINHNLFKKGGIKSLILTNSYLRICYGTVAVLLLVAGGTLEVYQQFTTRFPGSGLEFAWMECYLAVIIFSLLEWIRWKNVKLPFQIRIAILLVAFLYYTFNSSIIFKLEKSLLKGSPVDYLFLGHWLAALFILAIILRTIHFLRNNMAVISIQRSNYSWGIAIILTIFFSVEMRNLYVWLASHPLDYTVNLYAKAGLSIVWGILSFLFIWIGLKYKLKSLRIFALLLFGTTLIKLFSYDIVNIPPGGKIVAFILLGVLLLIVSFMYQRLKKMLIDDPKEES